MGTLEAADAELIDDDVNDRICIQLQHTAAFLFACAKAAFALRTRPLERIVESIRRRKAIAMRSDARRATFDCTRNRNLVAVFNRLCPLVPSPRDAGLFKSLALIEFLALYKSYPTWMWGVTNRPFSAHLWVQQEGRVFNSPVEYILRFTPILAV